MEKGKLFKNSSKRVPNNVMISGCTNSTLYIEGRRDIGVESQIVLHFLKFANLSAKFQTNYVVPSAQDCFLTANDTTEHSIVLECSVPRAVKSCSLPCVYNEDYDVCWTGMCNVVRTIVLIVLSSLTEHETASKLRTDLNHLLGFRGCSLKACAEVSSATKYCERDVIRLCCDKLASSAGSLLKILDHHLSEPSIPYPGRPIIRRPYASAKQPPAHYIEGVHFTICDLIVSYCLLAFLRLFDEIVREKILGKFPYVKEYVAVVTNIPGLTHAFESVQKMLPEKQQLTETSIPWLNENVKNAMESGLFSKKSGGIQSINQCKVDDIFSRIAESQLFEVCADLASEPVDLDQVPAQVHQPVDWDQVPAQVKDQVPAQVHQPVDWDQVPAQVLQPVDWDQVPAQVHQPVDWDQVPAQVHQPVDWDQVPAQVHPGIHLPKARVLSKCHQLESMLTAVCSVTKPRSRIVEFCAGGGHLGILIAHRMPDCEVVLLDNKENSVQRAIQRVRALELTNVTLVQGNMDNFRGRFDVGVALHACGTATDMVLEHCFAAKAAFVVCPCCYGKIQPMAEKGIQYPRSPSCALRGDDYSLLAHVADQTEFQSVKSAQGREAMRFVDSDRLEHARVVHGYKVWLGALTPRECSPKNHCLVGYRPMK